MKQIAIIKAGSTFPELTAETGDFEDWIIAGLPVPREQVTVYAVHFGQKLPSPETLSAAIITGSHAMVTDGADWMLETMQWVRKAWALHLPLLGICFGHQLLAESLGGRTDWNPLGREIGSTTIRQTMAGRADILLGQLPLNFPAHVSHRQSVIELPTGATLLAASKGDPHQAFRMGSAWGVQFHPEFFMEAVAFYIRALAEELHGEGLDADRLLAGLEETPDARSLLRRFTRLVRGESSSRQKNRDNHDGLSRSVLV